MITPIDVVDSAVKIGLGAMISGLATYWLAKASHAKSVEKERAQHKRELLEIITEQVARFDQFVLDYWEKVANWLAFAPPRESLSEELKAQLTKLENQIKNGYKDLKSAEAKLLLLGETECQKLLRDYGVFVKVYRQDVIASRNLTVEELKEYKDELQRKREKFLTKLSHIYKHI